MNAFAHAAAAEPGLSGLRIEAANQQRWARVLKRIARFGSVIVRFDSGAVRTVKLQRRIELLSGKQEIIRGCAAGGQKIAEGIIVVLVGSFASVESS